MPIVADHMSSNVLTVAPDSNVQSVVFAWPDVWVANAQGLTPAARTTYHRFNLEQLFAGP